MNKLESHQFFSAHCFNEVWGFLEKTDRTAGEDRLMREMAHASLFHWLSRDDLEPVHLSVGLWQISRVYSVLEQPNEAMSNAEECLEVSEKSDLGPFYLGYAYEAASRAAKVAKDPEAQQEFWKLAMEVLEKVEDADEQSLLKADLESLQQ